MKKGVFVFILFAFSSIVISQNNSKVCDTRKMSKAELGQITGFNELCTQIPKNGTFFSSEIAGKCDGKFMEAKFSEELEAMNSDVLNMAQLFLLKCADVGSKIYIDVKYHDPDSKELLMKTVAFAIIVTE